jgi:arylsulfatase A-like enzyme
MQASDEPQRYGVSELAWRLDPAQVSHQGGRAYLVPIDADVPSNADGGTSPLVMREDGVDLDVDNLHANIREQDGGRFSHWRQSVYFSATDGSDPRENGRQYDFVLPGHGAPIIVPWLPRMLGVACVLALLGLLTLPARAGRLAALLALILVIVAWWGQGADNSDPFSGFGLQDLADVLGSGEILDPITGSPTTGNVTQLTDIKAGFVFVADGPAPEPLAPMPLSLALDPGVEEIDGLVILDQAGSGIVGLPTHNFPVVDLADFILRLRVLQGTSLELDFVQSDGAQTALRSIVIPVQPDDAWQTLRITEPLGIYSGSSSQEFEGLRVTLPADSQQTARLQIEFITVSKQQAVFRRATHGRDALEIGQDRRFANWQSTIGSFRVPYPKGRGRLIKGSIAALESHGAEFSVGWLDSEGQAFSAHTAWVSPRNGWSHFSVRIPEHVHPAELTFSTGTLPTHAVLAWSGLRLVDDSRLPRRVYLTLMDTLRADALSCYGSTRSQTPALDTLAKNGVRFEAAISQCFWTRPSMVSLMTGRYGESLGVHTTADRLPASYQTLAESFSSQGFHTAAFVTNTNAGPASGLGQGWDQFQLVNMGTSTPNAETFLERDVEPELQHLMDEDLLLYVHLMDAHGPYGPYAGPPEGWDVPPGKPLSFDSGLDHDWLDQPTDTARIELYHLDVESMDAEWGASLARILARWESADGPATVVAVASDHGEFLGEYDRWSHIYYQLTPEIVRVPLIVRAPGLLPADRVISAPVENIDLAPTLLALAGLDQAALGTIEGESLLPLVLEGRGESSARALTSARSFNKSSEEAPLFSEYAADRALLGVDQTIAAHLAAPWDPSPSDLGVGNPRDASTVPDRAREQFLEAWRVFVKSARIVKTELWADVDVNTTQLDAAALQSLREMGYLR